MRPDPAPSPERLLRLWQASELPARDPLAHLLGRVGHGLDEASYREAARLGSEAWLERQLSPLLLPTQALEAALARNFPSLAEDAVTLVQRGQQPANSLDALRELRAATLLRRLLSPAQLHESMVEFWGDHFSVFHLHGPVRWFKSVDDRDHIRPHALGRFVDLLKASARSPAMLVYLDNAQSRVGGPNENYARELLELHTLGVDGGYTEQDVAELARVLTGWTLDRQSFRFVFDPRLHDFGAKRFMGLQLPAGRGLEEGERVLEFLAAHPATARHIGFKLARRFVADEPPPALVERLALRYLDSGGQISVLLRELFGASEFAESTHRKFRRPQEFLFAALRASEARLSGEYVRDLNQLLEAMAHLPFMWAPPNGYPDHAAHWLGAGSLLQRWTAAWQLASGAFAPRIVIDWAALAGRGGPAEQVDALAWRLLRAPLRRADRDLLVEVARAGEGALVEVGALLLASPYFQLR